MMAATLKEERNQSMKEIKEVNIYEGPHTCSREHRMHGWVVFIVDRLLHESQTPPLAMTYRTRLVARTRSPAKQLFPSPGLQPVYRLIIQHGDKLRVPIPVLRQWRPPRSDTEKRSRELGVDSRRQWRTVIWLTITNRCRCFRLFCTRYSSWTTDVA